MISEDEPEQTQPEQLLEQLRQQKLETGEADPALSQRIRHAFEQELVDRGLRHLIEMPTAAWDLEFDARFEDLFNEDGKDRSDGFGF